MAETDVVGTRAHKRKTVVDVESALAFVAHQGNNVEQARLGYLLAQEAPSQAVISQLLAGQRDDGGWSPFWAQDYSSLDATCFRLAQAEQLGINHSHAAITRAIQFLALRQQADGSWEEDTAAAAGAPRWVRPGDVAARLYLTANCGFWLAMSGEHDGATKAATYLQARLDENGHMPSFPHTHWLAAGLWYRLNWQEPAERIARHLGQQLAELSASNLAWLIITLRCAGVPARHTVVDEAASLLEQNQHQDGRWPSEDGADWDVHVTLEALRARRLCGRF
jgi:Squalene-hopene cyclase C-terminal domain